MSAGKYNILIEQGATFKKIITLKDANNVPINLSTYSIASYCKAKVTDTVSLFQFTVVIEDALTGKFSLNLTKTQTEALNFTTAVYDVELTVGSIVSRLLEGSVVLSKGVTQ